MNALTAEEIRAWHGHRLILQGANLHVPLGSITALLGQNGSGKSTLMRTLLGLHRRTRGSIQVLDLPPGTAFTLIRQRATFVPTGGAAMPGETARTHFAFGARMYLRWDSQRAFETAGELHVPLDRRADRLSTGQKMGLALAYALGSGAELLLLDEPTNGLDPDHRALFAQLLAAYAAAGNSALLSSHVLPEVEGLADRGAFLKNGQVILEAELDELRAQHVIVQAILPDLLPAGQLERLQSVPGVESLDLQGRTLTVRVSGSRDPLLRAVSALRPVDVQFKPRPLAEAYAALVGEGK